MRGRGLVVDGQPGGGGAGREAGVVPHASAFEEYTDEQKQVLRTEDLDDILANSVFFDGVPDLESFQPMWRQAKARM